MSNHEPDRIDGPLPGVTRAFSIDDGETLEEVTPSQELDFDLSPRMLDRDRSTKLPILGEYLIEDRIGAGGMGQVFRARHRTMDRQVAIKVLPRAMSSNQDSVDRFYAEVRATAKLMHPNIVTAFDAGCYRSGSMAVHYLVMELINGDLLSHRIAQVGPLNAPEVVEILSQAASALEYAHSQGIVHRDIKPSNMMITPTGILKILDFGLAALRDYSDVKDVGKKQQLMGTVEFMSPEQINAPEKVDHRSDLYSLGATIFYLLTGRPMFQGEAVQTALAQINRKPPALYEVRSDVDIRLDSVFQSLVAKELSERCPSAMDLVEKLYKLHLLERPAPTQRVRSGENRLIKLDFEHPTSVGLGKSTSQRAFGPFGIELGMIQSRVSFVDQESKVEEVLVDGDSLQLRNMLFSDGERIAVGSSAANLRAAKPNQIFYGPQRWYGLPLLERPFGGRQVPPEVLVAGVIRQLSVAARHKLPTASHAVINVPACYDQLHRACTKTACAIAGVEVLQLLDKPLAAALAHSEIEARLAHAAGTHLQRNLLVVMLGGAACEASVVQVDGVNVRMLASVGDWKRGIIRWHDRVAKRIAAELESKFGNSAREDLSLASRVQRTVERAFERLRVANTVPFLIEVGNGKLEKQLDRERMREWVDDLMDDCVAFAKEAIQRAKIDPSTIDCLLLSGDVRWLPGIQNELVRLVGSQARVDRIQSSDLARGAAIQARYVMPPVDLHAPIARGCCTYDLGVMIQDDATQMVSPKVLIAKDTPLPANSSRTLRFTHEGKRQPLLQFVEGSRLGATTWNRLGIVDLQTCFPGRVHSDPLQLRLDIDESGIWSGSLTWLAGNRQFVIPPLSEPVMDIVSMRQWRDWLESLMLCNTEML